MKTTLMQLKYVYTDILYEQSYTIHLCGLRFYTANFKSMYIYNFLGRVHKSKGLYRISILVS